MTTAIRTGSPEPMICRASPRWVLEWVAMPGVLLPLPVVGRQRTVRELLSMRFPQGAPVFTATRGN